MQITTIGLDIAKNVFQVHGMPAHDVDAAPTHYLHPRLYAVVVLQGIMPLAPNGFALA